MVVLIAAALLAQTTADVEFMRVEVEWMISTLPANHPLDFASVLPWRDAALLCQLDCDRAACRDLAWDELDRKADPWPLLWGIRWGSNHVRHECDRILEGLLHRRYACRSCRGRGHGKDPREWCTSCGGVGDLRYEMRWDYEIQSYVFRKRPIDWKQR
jgi:hypothetical protein